MSTASAETLPTVLITTEQELTLPKYEGWAGYTQGLPFVIRRYCRLWGRGT